jgi:hypothetical protein
MRTGELGFDGGAARLKTREGASCERHDRLTTANVAPRDRSPNDSTLG